jgi:type I restriction enzyme S subunit
MKQLFKKLSSVCEIKNGYAFKSNQYKDEGTPLLRISNFDNGDVFMNGKQIFVDSSFLKTKNNFIVEKGDVLIALSGATTGKYGIYNFDYPSLLNQRIGLIKSDQSDKLDSRYFFYYLHVLKVKILQNAGGAAQPNISTNKISEFEIRLPSLKTQQRIAGILDDAAALRDKTAQLLTEYNLLAQSVFLEMFGDIGMSNKKENFTPLKNLVVQKPDNGFFAKNELYVSGGVPIVWLNNFIDKLYIEQEDLRRAQILPKDEKYSLEYGDALFCRSSLTAEGIGKCAIVPKKMKEKTLFECHIIRLKFNLNKIIPEYFRFLSDTGYFRANIGKRSKTSTMTTISQDGITDIKIPVPPIKLQIQFADKIAIIEQQKALAKQELQESEDLFNCLLQQAFKGELV